MVATANHTNAHNSRITNHIRPKQCCNTIHIRAILKNETKKYSLIKDFGKLSGIPVLINTSFNVRGEPIVCTPQDAYNCFKNTGIDYLVMNNFLIRKTDSKTT